MEKRIIKYRLQNGISTKFFGFIIVILLLLKTFEVVAQQPSCLGESGALQWMRFENNIGTVDRNPFYPQNPSRIDTIHSLETEPNFNDYYVSLIKGFLMTPVSGVYYFNVTGSDYVEFYLSTDYKPENASLLVNTTYTSYSQFNAKPEQTDTVVLEAGRYYYFELHQSESTGSDMARVSWITPFGINDWRTIGAEYLYGYTCHAMCESKGTPCDDGNSKTVNDMQDGACNCFGTPIELPECAGERDQVQILYYDNIPGSEIVDMLANPAYPLMPSRSEIVSAMRMVSQSSVDSFGSAVKAYLKVPVSGNYEFSVIGNTRAELYLSPANDMSSIAMVANSSGVTSSRMLQSDELYYIKLLHKESVNSEEFAALWKTPFSFDNNWKYIDGAYLYQYGCELACIPEGTPCDDGDMNTINDAYDNSCNCVGIYCPNGDCPESTKFPPVDPCASTEKHSTYTGDSWLSCDAVTSLNSKRGSTHWIQYDLGRVMPIGKSHIWNYNVAGETGKGFREVAIDHSVNGTEWNEFGQFEWPKATGTNEYTGFEGPDFTGVSARYILLSGLTNWENSTCRGFSEIKFQVAECPQLGTLCDDHNNNTENDQYDANCICRGTIIDAKDEIHLAVSLKLFPNPSKQWTSIVFYLPEATNIDLDVFDMTGQLVYQLAHNQRYGVGSYQKLFPAQNISNGNYLVRLRTATMVITEKLLVKN